MFHMQERQLLSLFIKPVLNAFRRFSCFFLLFFLLFFFAFYGVVS